MRCLLPFFLSLITLLYSCSNDDVPTNAGKSILVLSGDITDSEAAEIIASDLGSNTQTVKIFNTSELTEVNLSQLNSAVEITIENNKVLERVDLSGLTNILGPLNVLDSPLLLEINLNSLQEVTDASVFRNVDLKTLNLPLIKSFNRIELNNTGINEFNAPNLMSVDGLAILDEDLESLSLPSLVTGSISIQSSSVSSLSFPSLTIVDSFTITLTPLQVIDLPSLEKITYRMYINFNNLLESISLPNLKIAETVIVQDNVGLVSLSMPKLEEASELKIINNNSLTNQNLNSISTIHGDFFFQYNGKMNLLNLNSLISVKGWLQISSNSSLNNVDFTHLTSAEKISMESNKISSISFPELLDVTDLTIYNNRDTFIGIVKVEIPKLNSLGKSFYVNAQLPSEEVNYLLNRFVSISPPISGKSIGLSQNPSAPPTGQGIIDKTTLSSNGNNILTN